MRIWTWTGLSVAALLIVAVLTIDVVFRDLDAGRNAVVPHAPWPVSAEAAALHDTLLVSDLHADTLLWSRDPVKRHDWGHTDFPRFREGGVFLQVFAAVTKSPSGLNYHENDAESWDDITSIALLQRWPVDTWGSLEARARYQARRLARAARHDDDFEIILTREDLAHAIARRRSGEPVLVGVLATEGSHALDQDLDAIDRLYGEGYRMMGLQHFFDNAVGGSLHGVSSSGLSAFGAAAVDRMVARDIMIDVAHSSEAVVRDVLDRTDAPLVVSHTGFLGACDTPRNIDDALMIEIAARGGLIGIGFWDEAICDASPDGIAAAIRYGIDLVGEDAIALGSDFDGTVTTYIDVSELAAVTDALLRAGVTPSQIEKVMGGNQVRFFLENLPAGDE